MGQLQGRQSPLATAEIARTFGKGLLQALWLNEVIPKIRLVPWRHAEFGFTLQPLNGETQSRIGEIECSDELEYHSLGCRYTGKQNLIRNAFSAVNAITKDDNNTFEADSRNGVVVSEVQGAGDKVWSHSCRLQ